MKRIVLVASVVLGVLASAVLALNARASTAPAAAGAVARALSPATVAAVRSDADWILAAQLPDGAIARSTDRQAVWPYLANFASMGIARAAEVTGDGRYADAAWRWLAWYQRHEDANGFVTDYTVNGTAETSTGSMDSTDAYAGTYLLAVRRAWNATADKARLSTLRAGIAGAVRAIETTQDIDGLTRAKPSWPVKYLMDQAETYGGLRAAVELATVFGDKALAARADADAGRVQTGVGALWNPAVGAYDWAVHGGGGRQTTRWSLLYPDAAQQAWAVAFGLVPGGRAGDVMRTFAAAHPRWDSPAAVDTFDSGVNPVGYWPVIGWAFARTGDPARAATAAINIRSAGLAVSRAWPFTTGVAGELVTLESSDTDPVPA